MTKHQQAFQEMLTKYKAEFEAFKEIHDLYARDQQKWQGKFDELGKPITFVVQKTEDILCRKMESSGKGVYSANLSEKFRQEVKAYLPLIDFVGVKIS